MEIRSVSSSPVTRSAASSIPEAVAGSVDSASPATTTATQSTGAGGYISPFLRYDQGARVAVLLFRDVDTGETQDQIPSRQVVEEYRRAASRAQQTPSRNGANDSPSSETSGSRQTASPDTTASTGATASGATADVGVSFASSSFTAASPTPTASAAVAFAGGGGSVAVSSPTLSSASVAPSDSGGFGSSPGGLVSVTV